MSEAGVQPRDGQDPPSCKVHPDHGSYPRVTHSQNRQSRKKLLAIPDTGYQSMPAMITLALSTLFEEDTVC